jgi:cardiolipin synthase (CMP-forming)
MTWLNWPNRITLIRIALIIPYLICLLNLNTDGDAWRYGAIGLLVVMGLSDALDGYLARRLNQITALGRFLDPLADKLVLSFSVILLSLEASAVPGYQLPNWVPVVAIGKDVLTVIGFLLIYNATGQLVLNPQILGKACTAVQFAMVVFCLIAPDLQRVVPHTGAILAVLYWTASVLAVAAYVDYAYKGNRFAAAFAADARRQQRNHTP